MAAGGCSSSAPPASTLLGVKGQLPKAWLKQLPSSWRPQLMEGPQQVLTLLEQGAVEPGLLALGDGWAQELDRARLQPLQAEALLEQLAPFAAAPSRLFAPVGSMPVAFPWAFGTWLLLLRNRADLERQRRRGWELLMDPSLKGKVVLPSSPRLVIDLALRQLGLSTTDPASLEHSGMRQQVRALVAQAQSLDESHGLNLLLAGEAEAAVVPSHQAIPLLQKDPRLSAFLPDSGSPLWWQLLLRPAPLDSLHELPPLPLEWLRDGCTAPLVDRLLAAGWVPPLPRPQLDALLRRWPPRLRPLLLPPEPVLSRCTNLVAFSPTERKRWQSLWDQALSG
ncbi:MAG: hypothetical protein FJ053_03170 [Cyanobacteria bacterium M_surface_10_m1_298]|nr:hypothetical protein [Cyanobacteria bacterium M_surface_10_m1_298]